MKVTADQRKRVVLPDAKPGDCFDVQIGPDGKIILTLLAPISQPAAKVKIQKEDGFTVGVLDRPINEAAIADALAEFP